MASRVHCKGCGRTFNSFQCLQQHLNGAKNQECARAFVDERYKPMGESGLVRFRGKLFQPCRLDTPEMAGQAAEILEVERQRSVELDNANYAELELNALDEDLPPPQKQVRVGDLGQRRVERPRTRVHDGKDIGERNLPFPERRWNPREEEQMAEGGAASVPVGDVIDVGSGETAGANESGKEEAGAAREGTQEAPDTSNLDQFKAYVEHARRHHDVLSGEMTAAIELMTMMNEHGGSAMLCEKIFKWHMEHLGVEKYVSPKQPPSAPCAT